ncbi:unnamed protein product [Lathyrus oleraceus]
MLTWRSGARQVVGPSYGVLMQGHGVMPHIPLLHVAAYGFVHWNGPDLVIFVNLLAWLGSWNVLLHVL